MKIPCGHHDGVRFDIDPYDSNTVTPVTSCDYPQYLLQNPEFAQQVRKEQQEQQQRFGGGGRRNKKTRSKSRSKLRSKLRSLKKQ